MRTRDARHRAPSLVEGRERRARGAQRTDILGPMLQSRGLDQRRSKFTTILFVVAGFVLSSGSCGKSPPGSDAGSGDGAAGQTGGAGSGGEACGTKTCALGGQCCYACLSLCAAPGGTCPAFLVDPCPQRDGAAETGQACTDKGPACPSAQVCDLSQPGRCAASTASGTCITKPSACALDFVPVCGCDGKTYGNDCARQSAGAQLNHAGAC